MQLIECSIRVTLPNNGYFSNTLFTKTNANYTKHFEKKRL